ncbi:MAG TPA: phenylalanine--tRNA ligase subunit beta [Archaeoglobaceae archaeon]|nr:phenylalanine--tRNA ligase subunit beta [Archaeoglobaceae archaeon]
MPVIQLYWDELERLVGKSKEEILERLPMLGCDIERVEEDTIDVEFFPNRPDLYSIEGVARALRGFLDVEHGYKKYDVRKSSWKVTVESRVFEVRPRIVSAVVRDIEITDEVIRSLMEVQEDLHWTIGRNRRKMAIGVHDLSKVYFPLRYTAVDESFSFIPLDFDEVMSVREILEKHPKGKVYSFILEGKNSFPMIIDSENEAISFPPIINAEKTRVTEETTDLFIDVTGFDDNVDKALNILTTMLADRGGILEEVKVLYPDRTEVTPDLRGKDMSVNKMEIESLLGFELSNKEVEVALKRMRFGVEKKGDEFLIRVPPYRADVMHEWDIIEDIAIGYGYYRIKPEYPPTTTIGMRHPWNELKEIAREIMTGLGFLEVITFTLTNERVMYEKMRRKSRMWKEYVLLMHAITEEHTTLRTDIMPKLIELLSLNKHHPYPQRIFEVGDVVVGSKNRLRLSACSTHSRANFSEIRSIVQAVMRELEIEWYAENSVDDAFIEGRRGDVIVNGTKAGVFGEIHPEVLESFQLTVPVVGFELDLSELFDTGEIL